MATTFAGNFDPAILPVQQFISWVQYSSFADGAFTLEWREEFDGPTLPSGWALGNWLSPKNLSTHQPANVTLTTGLAVLSLTADDATGFAGTAPSDVTEGAPGEEPSTDPDEEPGLGGSGGGEASGGAPGGTGSAGSADSAGSAGDSDGAVGGSASNGEAGSSAGPLGMRPRSSSDGT